MGASIKEILKLENFNTFRVICGQNGLENNVNKIGILDYETDELIKQNFLKGELIVTTLVVIRDDIDKMYSLVETMISIGISGLAIKNIYFDELPQNVIKLANDNDFPIMIFSDIFFEDVMSSFMSYVKLKEKESILASKIDSILNNDFENVLIRKIAYEINKNFKECHIVVFCKRKKDDKSIYMENLEAEKNKFLKIISYKEGYLIINTFDKNNFESNIKLILQRIKNVGLAKYIMGISNIHDSLDNLKYSINESLYAYRYSYIYDIDISYFNKIGVNKLLIPLMNNPWVLKYHDEIIKPIVIYDKKNDTKLLETAIKYVENNADIKKTSKALFQHQNTIRYRINKTYSILEDKCNLDSFYEELSCAIRIYNLINLHL